MRWDAKKDSNHNEIKEVLEEHGLTCIDTHRLGNGAPDMIVFGVHEGWRTPIVRWVEIKAITGTMTDDEEKFHAKYGPDAIDASPVMVARTAWDILREFGL